MKDEPQEIFRPRTQPRPFPLPPRLTPPRAEMDRTDHDIRADEFCNGRKEAEGSPPLADHRPSKGG